MLLQTKLFTPPAPPKLLARPRLLGKKTAVFQHRLTLISAPAGFGKTTLATTLAPEAAWLSLGDADDALLPFLRYLLAALAQRIPEVEQTAVLLQSSPLPATTTILTILINQLAEQMDEPLLLILDDYHLIQELAVHEALTFLIDHMPAQLHLLLTSRTDPPLPLARWRARQQLLEIRAADLRLTLDETTRFCNDLMALNLPPEQLNTLIMRTEGWVTGLQLATLAMQSAADNISQQKAVEQFSGRHHHVLDYLVDEVISRQPEEVQAFLLQTAVLDQLSAPLCQFVIDDLRLTVPHQPTINFQATLEQLYHSNLFLIPLDSERRWFRYHHLFAEMLQQRLLASYGETAVCELHKRAALWHQQENRIPQAIEHALSAGDDALVTQLILAEADALWTRADSQTLQGWIERLPSDVQKDEPLLLLYLAWANFFEGQTNRSTDVYYQQARRLLDQAEAQLQERGHIAAESRALGMLYAIRLALVSLERDSEQAIALGKKALQHLPQNNLIWRGVVSMSLSFAYQMSGQPSEALALLPNASRFSVEGGNLYGACFAYGNWATLLMARGQLDEAAQVNEEALNQMARAGVAGAPMVGRIHIRQGELHLLRYELAEAAASLEAGIWRYSQGELYTVEALFKLALVYELRGDGKTAVTHANQALANAVRQTDVPPVLTAEAKRLQAELALLRGEMAAVTEWRQELALPLAALPAPWQELAFGTLTRHALRQGEAAVALVKVCVALVERVREMGENGRLLDLLLLLAEVQFEIGEQAAAQASCVEAVALAADSRSALPFLLAGPSLVRLLRGVVQAEGGEVGETAVRFAQQLLQWRREREAAPLADSVVQPLVEPLSQRELTILHHIARGKTNRQIADELVVALSTIKWHINNIYGKLGVRTRAQAIAKALSLKLVRANKSAS